MSDTYGVHVVHAVRDEAVTIDAIVGPVLIGDLDTPVFSGPAFTVYLAGVVAQPDGWRREVASQTFVVRPDGSGGWLWSGETLPGNPDLDFVVDGATPDEVATRIAQAWRQTALWASGAPLTTSTPTGAQTAPSVAPRAPQRAPRAPLRVSVTLTVEVDRDSYEMAYGPTPADVIRADVKTAFLQGDAIFASDSGVTVIDAK